MIAALFGGVLIGVAAGALWLACGRIAGVSGVLRGIVGEPGERGWRIAFVLGLIAGGAAMSMLLPGHVVPSPRSLPMLAVGGVLVGFGTSLGGGCTSGHGVCGVGRLSPRSVVATITFVAAGMATVAVIRCLGLS